MPTAERFDQSFTSHKRAAHGGTLCFFTFLYETTMSSPYMFDSQGEAREVKLKVRVRMEDQKEAIVSQKERVPPPTPTPTFVDYPGVSRDVIVPPCNRRPRKSKYYTRPVFKEPAVSGRKSEAILNDKKHRIQRHTFTADRIREGSRLSPLDCQDDGPEVIRPASRTQYRLKAIVGNQSKSIGYRESKRGKGLERRLLQPSDAEYIDSSASVVTCSNLDHLESKRLKNYALVRDSSDISNIRKEVSKIIKENVTPKQIRKTKNPKESEGRGVEKTVESNKEVEEAEGAKEVEGATESKDNSFSGGLESLLADVQIIQSFWECWNFN